MSQASFKCCRVVSVCWYVCWGVPVMRLACAATRRRLLVQRSRIVEGGHILYIPSDRHTPYQERMLDDLSRQNRDALRTNLPNVKPPHRPGNSLKAPTIDGAKPIERPDFITNPFQNLEFKKQVSEYIEKGCLRPSRSPLGAVAFLVAIPHSNKWRLVCDWPGLNELRIRDKSELPNPK